MTSQSAERAMQKRLSNNLPRVGVFHPGTQHSWQTAIAFQTTGQLTWYATSAFYDASRWPYRIERYLPAGLARRAHEEFIRRHTSLLKSENVRRLGTWEWVEAAASRVGARRFSGWANRRGNESFGRLVIELVRREPVDVLWGYNTSSLEVFQWAKRQGIYCILDQTIGHSASLNEVMLAEQQRNPEFFLRSFEPLSVADIERQNEELELADFVVVASRFCASTLVENGCPPSKIRMLPYGFDASLFPAEAPSRRPLEGRATRFLFLGAIHPRKGVASLLQAFGEISPTVATLTLVGSLEIPARTFERYQNRILHVGKVPRPEVVSHLLDTDCFIFPSLFEGSALVLHEAGAAGLGIIQSLSAGEGARDGQNGIVLPRVSSDAIRSAVIATACDSRRLEQWQAQSWKERQLHTWQRYHEKARVIAVEL